MAKPFYVTTPIFYVNAEPHIGHVYTTLICDVVSRYHKLLGEEVYFMTGTDEHGQKIAQAAEAKGINPKEFCDGIAEKFKTAFTDFKFDFDYFIRTSDEDHCEEVQKVWKILQDKGFIEMGSYEGWYCISDEKFCTELEVEDKTDETGNTFKVSSESGHKVEWMVEENYKFKLSKFQEPLLKFYREHPNWIIPQYRQKEIEKFVSDGLQDLSVSRKKKTCTWGVPVPPNPEVTSEEHVVYVWLDALTNYYTAAQARLKAQPGSVSAWPADLHVIGKDILKFHAIYWPAFLLAADRPLPKQLLAHGWWTKDGKKISKSFGNAFDPIEKAKEFGLDALKYFVLRESSFESDGDYTDAAMINRLNGELADNLGNLFLRCTAKNLNPEQCIPTPGDYNDEDKEVIAKFDDLGDLVQLKMADLDIQNALATVFDGLIKCNQYVTTNEPWTLKKKGEEGQKRLHTILYIMADCLRISALLLSPVIPESSVVILNKLGVPENERVGAQFFKFGKSKPGTAFGAGETILFQKHQRKEIGVKAPNKLKKKIAAQEANDATALEIRVGEITSIKKHPEADTLYIETIDVGEPEPRQIISGLVKRYTEEELKGRKVLVWCNLKKAKLRKVDSCGMVLCVDKGDDGLETVPVPADAKPGTLVSYGGLEGVGFVQGEALNKKKVESLGVGLRTDENGVCKWTEHPMQLEGFGELKSKLVNATVR